MIAFIVRADIMIYERKAETGKTYFMITQEQWTAIARKERKADGTFWYALRRGRTYCRPSCPTKSPSVDRVVVFASCEEAEKAGYRPCRVCRPDQMTWQGARKNLAEKVRFYIEDHVHEKFSLQDMAQMLQVDGSYLLRTFHHETGHTPLWYHREMRCREACMLLSHEEYTVAEISAMVGFSTPALFSRVFTQMRGMSPSEYRKQIMGAVSTSSERKKEKTSCDACDAGAQTGK